MTALSQDPIAMNSKRLQGSLQLVETALAGTSLEVLSKAIDRDDTQVSKIRSGQLGAQIKDVVRMLSAAGLKVVSADKVCVDRARYEAMVTMASAAMADEQTMRRLTWDE